MSFGGALDRYLLSGEPGGAGGDVEGYEDDCHVKCESCPTTLCLGSERCEGGCCQDAEPTAFRFDGLDYCAVCADETRALIAEDIAREMAHGRGVRCAFVLCWTCEREGVAA